MPEADAKVDTKTSSPPTPLDERPLLEADKFDLIDENVENQIQSRIPAPKFPKGSPGSETIEELMLWAQAQPPVSLRAEAGAAEAAAKGSPMTDEPPDAKGRRGKKHAEKEDAREDSEEDAGRERPPKRKLVNPKPEPGADEIVEGAPKPKPGADAVEWLERNQHLKDTITNNYFASSDPH